MHCIRVNWRILSWRVLFFVFNMLILHKLLLINTLPSSHTMNGNGKNPDFLRTNISFNSGMADYRATTPTNFAALGIKTPNHTQMQPSQMSSQQSERFYNHYQREEIAEKLTKRLAPECISQRPAPGGGSEWSVLGTTSIDAQQRCPILKVHRLSH